MKQGIAVGIFVGALVGFIVALGSGAMGLTAVADAPDWLQGVSGVLALLVSVYVVTQVARTLKATQDTLDATRQMADDQQRIGGAQTRPWVLVEKFDLTTTIAFQVLNITLKNFGITPARNLVISPKLIVKKIIQNGELSEDVVIVSEKSLDFISIRTCAPNQEIKYTFKPKPLHKGPMERQFLEITLHYQSVHDGRYLFEEINVEFVDAGSIVKAEIR